MDKQANHKLTDGAVTLLFGVSLMLLSITLSFALWSYTAQMHAQTKPASILPMDLEQERLLAAHSQYLKELQDAKLRDRLTRLEMAMELMQRLQWALLAALFGNTLANYFGFRVVKRVRAAVETVPTCAWRAGDRVAPRADQLDMSPEVLHELRRFLNQIE